MFFLSKIQERMRLVYSQDQDTEFGRAHYVHLITYKWSLCTELVVKCKDLATEQFE